MLLPMPNVGDVIQVPSYAAKEKTKTPGTIIMPEELK